MFQNTTIRFVFILFTLQIVQSTAVLEKTSHDHDESRLKKSQEILKFMNLNADPCEDFYEFTCGNFAKFYTKELDTYNEWAMLYKSLYGMYDKLMSELKTPQAADSEADIKMKQFYRSCLNAPTLPDVYRKRLRESIAELGQMPVLAGEAWQEHNFDWVKLMAGIKYKIGLSLIVNVDVLPDFMDNTINRISLIQPNFNGVKENFLTEYLEVDKEMAAQAANEMIAFEMALANGTQNMEVTPPAELYATVAVNDVQRKYLPMWDTKKLISISLGANGTSHVMIQPSYLKKVYEVIAKTPKQTVANYIFYNYVAQIVNNIPSSSLAAAELEFYCLGPLTTHFAKYLENLMYRKFFTEQHKEGVKFLWKRLTANFEEILKSSRLEWMLDDTRKLAMDKMKAMQINVGTYEDIDFDLEFKRMQISDDAYLDNTYAALRLHGEVARNKINQTTTRLRDPGTLSAFYAPEENTITIPVLELDPNTLWSPSYPEAFNFAALGFYMAHEMLHGFDDVGRYYDASGNSLDWMDEHSLQGFEKRVKCFVDQYTNYTYEGRRLPEPTVQAENIADNGGIRLAYYSYQQWYREASTAKRDMEMLPALNFTSDQLFFISYGHSWCSVMKPNYYFETLIGDIHLPDKFRINGSLANLNEFSKVFHCPKDSFMNPVKKCEIY